MIRKRSVSIGGRRTSLSLEDAFWDALVALAHRRGISINALVNQIAGDLDGLSAANFSSACRLTVLRDLQAGVAA